MGTLQTAQEGAVRIISRAQVRDPPRSRMGHSSRSPGKLGTPGCGLKAKAPSLRKDWSKGTQRTRKLSTGGLLWSWRNAKERFVVLSDHGEGPKV